MSDSSALIQEPSVASATAEVDAESLGTGPQGKALRRERLQIAGKLLAQIAEVLNAAPVGTEYALVTRPIPPVSLPLPAGAATDATLATVAKDATLGTVGPTPGAYTVLDRLYQLGLKIDATNKALGNQATQLAALRPGVPKTTSTLLHRN